MNTSLILGFGSILGLVGMFGLVWTPDTLRSRLFAGILGLVSAGFALLYRPIGLVCGDSDAMLVFGAKSVGEVVPHTAALPITMMWSPVHIMGISLLVLGGSGLVLWYVKPAFIKGISRMVMLTGALVIALSIGGVAGLVGPHVDKVTLHNLARNTLAHLSYQVEAFSPSISCKSTALLGNGIFFFMGALGLFLMGSGVPSVKKVKPLPNRWILITNILFLLVISLLGQSVLFTGLVRSLSVIALILSAIALIEKKDLSTVLQGITYGIMIVLPFV